MKIKLAILEKDSNYLSRIVTAFNTKYSEQLEIYSFTDKEVALQTVSTIKIDVFIANEMFDIDSGDIPSRCGFAYFVEIQNIETLKGEQAICKFQKADLIYKQILSIYSEKAATLVGGMRVEGQKTHFLYISSASGGVGSSTIAAACAKAISKRGKKVLYVNLEEFGTSDDFFEGEGQYTFSDVIYAIKSRKTNLSLKLESTVKQDLSGVSFYSSPQVTLDILELKKEDVQRFLMEIQMTGTYEYVVIDADFRVAEKELFLWKEAEKVIMVSDGSQISNSKFERMYRSLQVLEEQDDAFRTDKLCILYNKFSNKTSKTIAGIPIKDIGGIPRFEHASTQEVVQQIANMGIIDRIVD